MLNTQHCICLFPWKPLFFFCLPPTCGVTIYICKKHQFTSAKVLDPALLLHKSNTVRPKQLPHSEQILGGKKEQNDRSKCQGDIELTKERLRIFSFDRWLQCYHKNSGNAEIYHIIPAGRRIRPVTQKKTLGCQVRQEVSTDPQLFKYFMSLLSLNNHVLKLATL